MKELLVLVLFGVLSICWTFGIQDSIVIDKCNLEMDSGFCRLYVEKHYYNSTSNKCQTFIYSGCGGNGNRFESKNECERSCMHPPIDEEIGDDLIYDDDEDDEDEDEDVNKPTPPSLFGKLFQKSLLTTFDLFKPEPLFDVFGTGETKASDDDDGDDDDDDEEEGEGEEQIEDSIKGDEEQDKKDEEEIKRNPFANIFDFLRPKIKTEFDPFSKRLTGNLFGNFWSKTMNRFREKIDRSFENMSKVLEKNTIPTANIKCTICKNVIKIIKFQIEVAGTSIKAILKLVEFICHLFPVRKATCEQFIHNITAIITGIEKGLSPEKLCENIELCGNSTLPEGVTQTISIEFTRKCSPLCNFMKAGYDEKAMNIARSLNKTEIKLRGFCDDKKIIKKCDIFFKMIEKTFGYLTSITTKQDEEHCKCFKRQPLFDTKKFDPCVRCNQFKKGMINEATYVNQSVTLLASRVKELCELFPSQTCTDIVSEFRSSLEYNTINLTNICGVTGYCAENTKKKNNSFIDRLKGSFSKLRGIFPDPKPMVMRGMGLHLRKFSPDCLFCKKCMGDLKETFKNVNETEVDSKNIYPAVKEGFSLYCQTTTVGTNYTTICKKISDGIETVHKVITKRSNNEEGMCKTLGVC